jgi:hypothetical protein
MPPKAQNEQDELLNRISKDSTPDELRRAAEIREQQLRTSTPFPSWRYHATKPAVLVKSEEEAKALGSGWTDSPDGDTRGVGNPELAALATETQALADRAANAAGIQTAHDRQRAESSNLLREALGGVQSPETALEQRRQAGQQANRERAESQDEARKLADYQAKESERLKDGVEGTFAARKRAINDRKAKASKGAAKKSPAKKAAKSGRLGGTRK